MENLSIGIIGGYGNIARCILQGLAVSGTKRDIMIAGPDAYKARACAKLWDIGWSTRNADLLKQDILVLCAKPSVTAGVVLPELRGMVNPSTLVISLAA